jgi:small subunit ribosomal protein S16
VAVKIRLARVGRKKSPAYRVVVADSRKARDGRFIEILGIYQPQQETPRMEIDSDRALKWLKDGAVPSDTVRSILRKTGVLKRFHEARKPAPKATA